MPSEIERDFQHRKGKRIYGTLTVYPNRKTEKYPTVYDIIFC